jgi:glycopeptide antibiotics resistance protein
MLTQSTFKSGKGVKRLPMYKMVCKKGCCAPLVIILTIGIINILYYNLFLKRVCSDNPTKCDFMNKTAFRINESCCSYWPISHFIMYFILGFLFPNCWPILILVGIGWEGLEFLFGLFEKSKAKDTSLGYSRKWWAPNVADLILNVLGLSLGVALAKALQAYKERYEKKKEKS